jgi:pyridoxine 4-dehydrogenase
LGVLNLNGRAQILLIQPFQEHAMWEGICNVYDQGLCDAIGVSNYGPKQLDKNLAQYIKEERP